jgi:hypothetical protein
VVAMPQGILIIGWDKNKGATVECKYPEWLPVPENEAMAIYNAHTLGGKKTGKIVLKLHILKVVSYYAGAKLDKCVSLILEQGENPNIYFENIEEILNEYINDSVGLKYNYITKIYTKFEQLKKAQSAVDKIIKFF